MRAKKVVVHMLFGKKRGKKKNKGEKSKVNRNTIAISVQVSHASKAKNPSDSVYTEESRRGKDTYTPRAIFPILIS
jgi:hypothetical protein